MLSGRTPTAHGRRTQAAEGDGAWGRRRRAGRFPRAGLALWLATSIASLAACSSTPAFAGWTAEQLYAHGEQAFAEEDWGDAREAFEHVLLTFPGFSGAVDARFFLARAFFEDEQYVSAVSEFTRIVQTYPDHERVGEAWMGLCRSYAAMSPNPQRDQGYTQQARTTCDNVAVDYRGTPAGDSAAIVAAQMLDKLAARAFGEAQFYFRRGLSIAAERGFLQVLEAFPATTSAPLALARLIEIYEELGWDEEREESETRLLEDYPDSAEAQALAAKGEPGAPRDAAAAGRPWSPPPATSLPPKQPGVAGGKSLSEPWSPSPATSLPPRFALGPEGSVPFSHVHVQPDGPY